MATWGDLITDALRDLTVLEGDETPESSDLRDGLRRLKDMLAHWSIQGYLVPGQSKVEHTFAATPSGTTFTVGPTNVDSPPDIVGTFTDLDTILHYREGDEQTQGLRVLKVDANFLAASSSPVGADLRPTHFTFDPAHPNAILALDGGIMAGDVLTLIGYGYLVPNTITQETEQDLPDEYAYAIRWNLVLELAPQFGHRPEREIHMRARDAKAYLKQRNSTPIGTELPPDLPGMRSGGMLSSWGRYGRYA